MGYKAAMSFQIAALTSVPSVWIGTGFFVVFLEMVFLVFLVFIIFDIPIYTLENFSLSKKTKKTRLQKNR